MTAIYKQDFKKYKELYPLGMNSLQYQELRIHNALVANNIPVTTMKKPCSKCKVEQSIDDFPKYKGGKAKSWCKECACKATVYYNARKKRIRDEK